MFGFALRGGLAIAFAQYLWRLLRVETMKVSTIELLFNIRSNIFVLLRPAALRAAPVLFALATLMWISQVVISFPPGALTVASTQNILNITRVVPTFNASFVRRSSEPAQYCNTDLGCDADGKRIWGRCKQILLDQFRSGT